MSNVGNFVGRRSSAASPFRSLSFMVVSILGLAAVAIDVYLILRHWNTAPAYVVPILGILIGVQLIYQWFRVRQSGSKLQELCSKELDEGALLETAVLLATRGIMDVLFFSYGIAVVALALIGLLLSRLDGL
jgi:hypothetical protein